MAANDWPPFMWPPATDLVPAWGSAYSPLSLQTVRLGGWQCPGCGACFAPAVTRCPDCPKGDKDAGPAVHLGSTSGPGPEHDLCAPPSEGGLCDHDTEPARCTGGRHCSC